MKAQQARELTDLTRLYCLGKFERDIKKACQLGGDWVEYNYVIMNIQIDMLKKLGYSVTINEKDQTTTINW